MEGGGGRVYTCRGGGVTKQLSSRLVNIKTQLKRTATVIGLQLISEYLSIVGKNIWIM